MTIKTVICYETTDGRIWKTLEQAKWWEWMFDISLKKQAKEAYETVRDFNIRNIGEDDHIDPYASKDGCRGI